MTIPIWHHRCLSQDAWAVLRQLPERQTKRALGLKNAIAVSRAERLKQSINPRLKSTWTMSSNVLKISIKIEASNLYWYLQSRPPTSRGKEIFGFKRDLKFRSGVKCSNKDWNIRWRLFSHAETMSLEKQGEWNSQAINGDSMFSISVAKCILECVYVCEREKMETGRQHFRQQISPKKLNLAAASPPTAEILWYVAMPHIRRGPLALPQTGAIPSLYDSLTQSHSATQRAILAQYPTHEDKPVRTSPYYRYQHSVIWRESLLGI